LPARRSFEFYLARLLPILSTRWQPAAVPITCVRIEPTLSKHGATRLGVNEAFTVPQLIELAKRGAHTKDRSRDPGFTPLVEVGQKCGGSAGQIDGRRLGKWLIKNENTVQPGSS
jgi:hypothetical protein